MDSHHEELLVALRARLREFPRPHASWHAYVDEINAFLSGYERALERLGASAAALAALEELLEGKEDGAEGLPQSLLDLPRPRGQHPYLDLIDAVTADAELVYTALGDTVER
jgi:hypothetical protein